MFFAFTIKYNNNSDFQLTCFVVKAQFWTPWNIQHSQKFPLLEDILWFYFKTQRKCLTPLRSNKAASGCGYVAFKNMLNTVSDWLNNVCCFKYCLIAYMSPIKRNEEHTRTCCLVKRVVWKELNCSAQH